MKTLLILAFATLCAVSSAQAGGKYRIPQEVEIPAARNAPALVPQALPAPLPSATVRDRDRSTAAVLSTANTSLPSAVQDELNKRGLVAVDAATLQRLLHAVDDHLVLSRR